MRRFLPVLLLFAFGRTRDGLPVGIQIVAAHGRDRFLLEVAAAVEVAVGSLG